jgi:arylsulfatase A-like enzyme
MSQSAGNSRPNILIICTDQQRFDSLGCTGNCHAVTPNLDAFAGDGRTTLFSRHITANPICMPSRASFATGRYVNAHGLWTNGVSLPRSPLNNYPSPPTMADVFSKAGYHTRSIGKLHFTPYRAPIACNFEESHARWENPEMEHWRGPYYGFQDVALTISHGEHADGHYACWLRKQHPEVFKLVREGKHRRVLPFPAETQLYRSVLPEEAHHSTWIADNTCAFLNSAEAKAQPFYLFASFPDPHHPFAPPPALADEFEKHDVMPWHFDAKELASHPSALHQLRKHFKYPELGHEPALIRRIRQYTDAMIHLIDKSVGRMIAALKENGLWENTIVIYTSDHGDFLGDHGLIKKSSVCNDTLNRVPFLMRAPDRELPRKSNAPMSNADVFPTLCELAGIPVPPSVQGRSVLPVLHGAPSTPVPVFCYQDSQNSLSIYDERYRFSYYPTTGERELYDHRDDPSEQNNRGSDPAMKQTSDAMLHTVLDLYARTTVPVVGRVAEW